MKSRLAVILILLFGGMLMVGVSAGVYASDQDSKSKPFIDTLTGLWVYKYPEVCAEYEGGDAGLLYDVAMMLTDVFKGYSFKGVGGYRLSVQFVITADGKVIGARPYPIKGVGISEYNRRIADYINSSPDVLRKWKPGNVNGENVNEIYIIYGHVRLQGTLD